MSRITPEARAAARRGIAASRIQLAAARHRTRMQALARIHQRITQEKK